jgi:acetyl-CoA acyltransferase
MVISAHCEDEATIRANLQHYKERFGDDIPMNFHPLIRSEQACYLSSSKARSMQDAVRLRSYGFCTNPLGQVKDLLRLDTATAASQEALRDANMTPQDVQVAEVHDCFTIAELMMYEAIGFAEPGKGMELMKSGRTSLEGDLPVNTGGGLVSFGHPVGATGVKQAAEIYRQMKGLCGDYQVQRELHTGLTVNMGGDDRTGVSLVLENVS